MHWLPALDTALFRFFNDTLKNPVFDVVMPWLSGNILFVPLLLVGAGFLIWRHRHKGILCVAMLALIVPLGDSFVSSTIKRAVSRPRPFVTLTDVHNPPGIGRAGNYSSMPSSHAANWFAAAMIAWIYFRRSARVTLPLAIAVSISRVYNGVHYPSDVLAGAILGAGYGAVAVYTLEALWRWAGKRFFPIWHAQLPSLVPLSGARNPEMKPTASYPQSTIDQHWLRAGCAVIAISTLARWIYLASGIIELSQDEAYQWQWSKHLALSYYSKPPLIAYTQFLGTSIWGDNEFGVRFFPPLIAATLGILVLRFFAREVNARAGFFLVLCMMASPLLSVGATLMTVDPLSVLFWTAAMFAGWKAIRPEAGVRQWAWVGLWMGLGFLSKYTALFQLLCWVVFFALWRPARIHLRRAGPWVALTINALCALPVIIWNQQHHWITATHVAGNAGLEKGWPPPLVLILEFFFTFLGQELFLLNPVFFVSALWAAVAFWRRYRQDARLVYFFSMGAPVFLIYLGWTMHSRVLPNWIAPSILPLFCLMAIYWEAERLRGAPQVIPSLASGLVIGFIVVLVMHDTNLLKKIAGRTLPDHIDPMGQVSGWRASADIVGAARQRLLAEGKPVFIIGSHYRITSLVAFYLPEAKAGVPDHPLVYYRSARTIDNQYHFWPGYKDRKGQNAVYVTERANSLGPPPDVRREFESITELPVQPVLYRGRAFHQLRLYECRNLR
jgi:membrane-associated phospholipid phosphatase